MNDWAGKWPQFPTFSLRFPKSDRLLGNRRAPYSTRRDWSLDFIGNTPAGFSDQSDAIHPVGFPIMTIIQGCSVLLAKARNSAVRWGFSRKKRPMPAAPYAGLETGAPLRCNNSYIVNDAPAARLESGRKSCAIRYILFCQSPYWKSSAVSRIQSI
ncbi:MAG: hypothetical protein BECKG1743E_GA0114224_101475 [Candidatus Kentron sp. G]|nr:MAG: hypothetical protein BECKG1743E_GA0114224_101475 [Candidatus Kentron sp. G]